MSINFNGGWSWHAETHEVGIFPTSSSKDKLQWWYSLQQHNSTVVQYELSILSCASTIRISEDRAPDSSRGVSTGESSQCSTVELSQCSTVELSWCSAVKSPELQSTACEYSKMFVKVTTKTLIEGYLLVLI